MEKGGRGGGGGGGGVGPGFGDRVFGPSLVEGGKVGGAPNSQIPIQDVRLIHAGPRERKIQLGEIPEEIERAEARGIMRLP